LWEYWVDVTSAPPLPPVVNADEREIYEVSLSDVLTNNGIQRFTGWKHLRIPFSLFTTPLTVAQSWRYTDTASVPALAAMSGSLDRDHIRAIIFRKGTVDPTGVMVPPPQPGDVTVAIDEIVVTGNTSANVTRINIPGATTSCDNNEDRGLCWAQLFASNPAQGAPYDSAVRPPGEGEANKCIDVTVWVRDWQDLNPTFSAEVDSGAEVSDTDVSSEIVFAPQFQVPGTWVQLASVGSDFSRRKGTMDLPPSGFLGQRFLLFFTDWRYDYTNGDPAENYLVHYDPLAPDPLDPRAAPEGGFLANYLREHGYAYGTLFVLPRDDQGNIGRARVVDVLFRRQNTRKLRYEHIRRGLP